MQLHHVVTMLIVGGPLYNSSNFIRFPGNVTYVLVANQIWFHSPSQTPLVIYFPLALNLDGIWIAWVIMAKVKHFISSGVKVYLPLKRPIFKPIQVSVVFDGHIFI